MDSTIETFLEDHGFTPIERRCHACQTQVLHSSAVSPGSDLAQAGLESIQMDVCVSCGCVELNGELSDGADQHCIATELDQLESVLERCMCGLVATGVH